MTRNGIPRLSVFKGREAKLNRAIFLVLAQEGPLTAYDICRKVRTQKPLRYTRYSVVNRRVRSLEEAGYVEKTEPKRTRAGFEAQLYQITFRAYLAIIVSQTDFNEFIEKAEENKIISALSIFIPTEAHIAQDA
jgi:DNA-binding PadR family transcriptional regulator